MGLPKSFENLANYLTILPGVGEKTAERYVYSLFENNLSEIDNLADALLDFKKNIKICSVCGVLSDYDICDICSSKERDKSTICVVEDSKNVFFIEKTKKYNGYYHVLNGLISPIEGINPEDLNISTLLNKRINDDIKEVIIALNPSIEGQVTSQYLKKLIDEKNIKDIKISRLSYGIPMGSDLEYLDPMMITKAWEDRKIIS